LKKTDEINEFIYLFAHLTELEGLKYPSSFPYWHGYNTYRDICMTGSTTPVSLLASMSVMRQVLGRMAATKSTAVLFHFITVRSDVRRGRGYFRHNVILPTKY